MRGLRDIDAGLVIYWNRFKNRFVIDRCINPDPHTHDARCERANVLMVEDEEHGYMTPNDRVLDKIKAMDAWKNYGTLENQRRAREKAKAEHDAKVREDVRENYRLAMIDDKRQISQALDLIQRHDVLRPNK